MKKNIIPRAAALAFFVFLCTPPLITNAGEIQYGALKDQRGETLLLEYASPAGTTYFACTIGGSACKRKSGTPPTLFPTLLGSNDYPHSADGTLAVKPFVSGTTVYYFLYNVSGTISKKIARLPYTKAGATILFAKNDNAVVFRDGTSFTRYDIASKELTSVKLPHNLDFLALSPSATYVTGYNYTTLRHELWKFADGTLVEGPSAMQSYLEFSEDETLVAYLDDVEGYKTLFTMSMGDSMANGTTRTQLTKPKTETEDYIFVGNTLYFLANVAGPLEWDLFAYKGGKTTTIDEDVSYGDYLKRVRGKDDTYLAYLKTTGKNRNITLVANGTGKKLEFAPAKASPASGNIMREVVSYGKRTGVLLSPSKAGVGNLFIWMHGGPQRQVAKGYHPYLSYAVYDELLERLAEGGNYVYKIDYTGSTGYGAAFRKALDMKIGDVEMKDIKNAIADIRKDKSINKVYLIGNSYGGYMALRGLVGMPDTVDGVVSINGVSDWYGLISAIPSSPFRELFNGVPDTANLDAYFKASVFSGMEKLTPKNKALVVWGEQDHTVPVSQSTKYVEYAKTKGVNVRALSFPTEEHIIRERKNLDTICKNITATLSLKSVSCSL